MSEYCDKQTEKTQKLNWFFVVLENICENPERIGPIVIEPKEIEDRPESSEVNVE